jgi:hypothetical protein
MKNAPKMFFATGAIFALVGMAWGIQMSASHDHLLSPAHGHLNLIVFVAMSIFGTYYSLTPGACESRLALLHYTVTVATVVILTPGIAMAISGQGEIFAQVGSLMALLSMSLFVFVVLRKGVGSPA